MIETLQIALCRKPIEGSYIQNVIDHEVSGLNIDGCRVPISVSHDASQIWALNRGHRKEDSGGQVCGMNKQSNDCPRVFSISGRFPANVIHDGSEFVINDFPSEAGAAAPVNRGQNGKSRGIYGDYADRGDNGKSFRGDSGSAARFFWSFE